MSEEVDSLNTRVAVLEVKFENNEKSIQKLEDTVSQSYKLTLQIKERLDKQNGALPHLAEDMKSLQHNQDKMFEKLDVHMMEEGKNAAKIKVLWGLLGAALSLGVGELANHFLLK